MISQIKLQNFRCYEDILVDFKDKRGSARPLNLIFGDNITGKTSFLMAFGFLKHSCESLMIDHLRKKRTQTEHEHDLKPFVLSEHINRHYRKGSHAPMVLEFDFISDAVVFRYTMVMIQGKLIEESLYRKTRSDFILCFHCKQNSIEWGTRILLADEIDVFESYIDKYHHEYSIMAIFALFNTRLAPQKIRIHSSIESFLMTLRSLYISIDRYYSHSVNTAYIFDHDLGPFSGYVDRPRIQAMENALPIINNLMQLMFPYVAELNYRVYKVSDDSYRYQIEIFFKNTEGSYSVPKDDIPKSLYDFLVIMSDLIGNPIDYTFLIDNFANNISVFSLKPLFETVFPLINFRGILTMADNDAMNLVNPGDIHIAWQKDYRFDISRLSSLFNVQQNHNLRSRYERGILAPTEHRPQKEFGYNVVNYYKKFKQQ